MAVSLVVEGRSDEGVAHAIVREFGLTISATFGGKGKDKIRKAISGYNSAAQFAPWFVLVDLDDIHECPVTVAREWLPKPCKMMCFRVAVVELEAWLLADRDKCAEFLGVSRARIPEKPDELRDPKQELINIARHSRKRDIREGLVPREGGGALVGPTYVSDIREFGKEIWRPRVAAEASPSLAGCLAKIEKLRAQGLW